MSWWVVMAVQTERCFDKMVHFEDKDLIGLLPVYRTKSAAKRRHPKHQIVEVQALTTEESRDG